ncbi:hypothetical protein C0J52_12960 [Blattella germanica]|nr:hypothetical protein C0J52_12960 [Blattella germanica]
MADRGRLITQERAKTVLLYVETKSVVLTQRGFRQHFNTRWAPVKNTIYRQYRQFETNEMPEPKQPCCSILFSINTKKKGHIWPPHSPDINPCDYFLWGLLKEQVFRQHPVNLLELRACIVQYAIRRKMSVPFSGTIRRSTGISSAIAKQLKKVNLKPIKRVVFKFDPFRENVTETRNFLCNLTCATVQQTNLNCKVKTEILCDRADPSVTFLLDNDETIIFKSANLTNLELLQLYNKHITSLVPPPTETATPQTKGKKFAKRK